MYLGLPCSSQINEVALTCRIRGSLHVVRENDYPEVLAMLVSFQVCILTMGVLKMKVIPEIPYSGMVACSSAQRI